MFEIIPFNKELLLDFKYNGIEREFSGEEIMPIIEFYSKAGDCYIGLMDGQILGVGGIYPLWKGAGTCYLFLNKEAKNYKKSVYKALLEYMYILIKKYEITTLMAECFEDSMDATSLITHLGFKKTKESKMSLYTKGV